MKSLDKQTQGSCRLSFLSISAHHSEAAEVIWGDANKDQACTAKDFTDSINLAPGAFVNLNMCNSCGLADEILKNNANTPGITVWCTDGENRNIPGARIHWNLDGGGGKLCSKTHDGTTILLE